MMIRVLVHEKYPLLARYGLQYFCYKALLDLRDKICGSKFDIMTPLYKRVFYDLLDHEEEIISRILEGENLEYYKNIFLDRSFVDKGTKLLRRD